MRLLRLLEGFELAPLGAPMQASIVVGSVGRLCMGPSSASGGNSFFLTAERHCAERAAFLARITRPPPTTTHPQSKPTPSVFCHA